MVQCVLVRRGGGVREAGGVCGKEEVGSDVLMVAKR